MRSLLFVVLQMIASCAAKSITISTQQRYHFTVDGNAIDSTNGKISYIDGQYLWIAEATNTIDKVTYSSPDLQNWIYNGPLFNMSDPKNLAACSGFGTCSRPKIVFNDKTKKYVFYGFAGKPGTGGPAVFTSDKLTSGYIFQHIMTPAYLPRQHIVEDLGLEVIDGTGYLLYTTFNLTQITTQGSLGSIWPPFIQTVVIEPLTDDFLNGTGTYYPVVGQGGDFPVTAKSSNLIDANVESPDLFRRNGIYYVVGSGTCANCNGTTALAYRSTSIRGPWTRQVASANSCGGQAMGVGTFPSSKSGGASSFVFQADQNAWASNGLQVQASKGHLFYALDFESNGAIKTFDCSADRSVTVDIAVSTKLSTQGLATTASDGSSNTGNYYSQNDIPNVNLYQTWVSSKTGTLKELGVNLAGVGNTDNITLELFRYTNNEALVAPFFKWESLGSVSITPAQVARSFQVVRSTFSAAVKKGDRLGFAIGEARGSGPLPYGYLISDQPQCNHTLFALNRDHVSFGGADGKASPVYDTKRELKWYAVVG